MRCAVCACLLKGCPWQNKSSMRCIVSPSPPSIAAVLSCMSPVEPAMSGEPGLASADTERIPICRPGVNLERSVQLAFPVVDEMFERRAAARKLEAAKGAIATKKKTVAAAAAAAAAPIPAPAPAPPSGRRHSAPPASS